MIAEAALISRSNETHLPFPVISLLELNIQNYTDDNIPKELKLIPPIKPGSRHYLLKNEHKSQL